MTFPISGANFFATHPTTSAPVADDSVTFSTNNATYWAAGGPIQDEAEITFTRTPNGDVVWLAAMVGGGELAGGRLSADYGVVQLVEFLERHVSDAGTGEVCDELPGLRSEVTFKIANEPYTADFTDCLDMLDEWLRDL